MKSVRVTRSRLSLPVALSLMLLGACEDGPIAAPIAQRPEPNLFQRALSEPVAVTTASGALRQAYIAFAAGELPNVQTVRISNLSSATVGTITSAVVNGALDPVAIRAAIGDTLELGLTRLDGSLELLRAAVPARRAPRVIRTEPSGLAGAATSSKVAVVFSEPINPASLTANTLRVSVGGRPLSGSLRLVGPALLTGEFIPEKPLASGIVHILAIGGNIRDLSGQALEAPVTVEFTPATPFGSLLLNTVTLGLDRDADGYIARIEGNGISGVDTLRLEGSLAKHVAPGTYSVTLTGVAANCTLTGTATRQIEVRPAAASAVDFIVACVAFPTRPFSSEEIAFVSERDGNSEIYVASSTGVQRLTFNFADDVDPAWSPDGSRIAFASSRGGGWGIYIMNADGSNVVRRTSAARYAGDPAWSPDGRQIAFAAQCENGQGCITVINADGDEAAAVQVGMPRGYHGQPSWSADGTEIAFINDWDAFDIVYDIFTAKVNSSAVRQLTHGFWFEPALPGGQIPVNWYLQPSYSPDGRIALLFLRATFGTRDQPPFSSEVKLAIMKGDGSGFAIIASAGETSRFAEGWPHSLTWSPDGRSIAFTSATCHGSLAETCAYSISVVKADGTDQYVLISNGHSPSWRR